MFSSLEVSKNQGQNGVLAEFVSVLAAVAILAAMGFGFYHTDLWMKKNEAPEKVAAFERSFGYKLAMDDFVYPKPQSIQYQLVQNLVNKQMAELLVAYGQKEAELAKLQNERDKIRALVPHNPQETTAAVASYGTVVGRINQVQAELSEIKDSWVMKGKVARDCGFDVHDELWFQHDLELQKNKSSPKHGSAGSEPRSGLT